MKSDSLDNLDGEQFEMLLKELFTKMGYKVHVTKKNHDFGIDLVLSKTIVVQAKRHKAKINIGAVQEVAAGRFHHHADEAWVVAASDFTSSATKCANDTGVRLIAREELDRMLQDTECELYFEPGRASDRQLKKARLLAAQGRVKENGDGTFSVSSTSGKQYVIAGDRCNCKWSRMHSSPCSHVLAQQMFSDICQGGAS